MRCRRPRGRLTAVFFCIYGGLILNIFVYSDESGVFDKVHNDFFVFGGLILLGADKKDIWSRKYSSVEKIIRKEEKYSIKYEMKATNLLNKNKYKLFRSLNNCYKFGVIIEQEKVLDRIFSSKKDKQRYLDYAYKIAIKRAFQNLIGQNIITPEDVERIFFYVDEHTTATNGHYELCEGLEQEFKRGTYNYDYLCHYPPLFPKMKEVNLNFCNSQSKLLIRAADIVANRIYYSAVKNTSDLQSKNLFITNLP